MDKIESIFSVNGYSEVADTYVPYGLFGTYIEAKTHLNTLLPLLRKGLLTDRKTKEPIDWLNIMKTNYIIEIEKGIEIRTHGGYLSQSEIELKRWNLK